MWGCYSIPKISGRGARQRWGGEGREQKNNSGANVIGHCASFFVIATSICDSATAGICFPHVAIVKNSDTFSQ